MDVINRKIVKSKSLKNTDNKPAGSTRKQKCRKCGYKHKPHKCPAFGKLCHNCKKKNHFSTVCKNKKMHELQVNDYDSDIFLHSVETDQNVKDWKVNMKICDKTDNMKLDTGAQSNVLPYHVYKQIRHKPLKTSKSRLVSYSGHRLPLWGKLLCLYLRKKYISLEFEIVKDKSMSILGLKACWN